MWSFVLLVALAASDAGTARVDVRRLIDDLALSQAREEEQRRLAEVAELRRLAATAPRAERALVERVARVLEKPLEPAQVLREFTAVLREAGTLARGRVDEERALGGAWLALPGFAQAYGLDPEPPRRAALAAVRDLAARYPKDGRMQGLLATALTEAKADDRAVLAALKRCAELDPGGWCPPRHARVVAELERPRCSGKGLAKALTATGATEAAQRSPGSVVSASGKAWTLEAKPFLSSADFASIAVDEGGDLAIDVTPAAAVRLEQETARLLKVAGGAVVLRLGEEVLLAAHVLEPISGGRVRVARGQGRAPFRIEELCSKIERPVVPAELKLRER